MRRVLVAHGDKSLRQLIKLQLVCAGYEVAVAEDAIEAGKVGALGRDLPPAPHAEVSASAISPRS